MFNSFTPCTYRKKKKKEPVTWLLMFCPISTFIVVSHVSSHVTYLPAKVGLLHHSPNMHPSLLYCLVQLVLFSCNLLLNKIPLEATHSEILPNLDSLYVMKEACQQPCLLNTHTHTHSIYIVNYKNSVTWSPSLFSICCRRTSCLSMHTHAMSSYESPIFARVN